jgi:dihydroorotate dehydrogenase (NAD+) catalytic subunit
MKLAVNLAPHRPGGFWLANPVIAASGTFGYGTEYADLIDREQLGAIVSKAVALTPRAGNPMPRLYETPAGLLNAIGLQGIGVERVIAEKAPLWASWRVPVIVNVVGESIAEFCGVVERLSGVAGVAGFELNVSCPNVEGGTLFGDDPQLAADLTQAVRQRTDLPLLVKLAPTAPDVIAVARAVAAAGADALVVANTWPGMAIDLTTRRPVFPGGGGGLSGPAIRPLSLRLVYLVAGAVALPVVGCGGVATAADALEYLMAGACAVQVGTMTFREPSAMLAILAGLREFGEREGLRELADIIGAAQPRPVGGGER